MTDIWCYFQQVFVPFHKDPSYFITFGNDFKPWSFLAVHGEMSFTRDATKKWIYEPIHRSDRGRNHFLLCTQNNGQLKDCHIVPWQAVCHSRKGLFKGNLMKLEVQSGNS